MRLTWPFAAFQTDHELLLLLCCCCVAVVILHRRYADGLPAWVSGHLIEVQRGSGTVHSPPCAWPPSRSRDTLHWRLLWPAPEFAQRPGRKRQCSFLSPSLPRPRPSQTRVATPSATLSRLGSFVYSTPHDQPYHSRDQLCVPPPSNWTRDSLPTTLSYLCNCYRIPPQPSPSPKVLPCLRPTPTQHLYWQPTQLADAHTVLTAREGHNKPRSGITGSL